MSTLLLPTFFMAARDGSRSVAALTMLDQIADLLDRSPHAMVPPIFDQLHVAPWVCHRTGMAMLHWEVETHSCICRMHCPVHRYQSHALEEVSLGHMAMK